MLIFQKLNALMANLNGNLNHFEVDNKYQNTYIYMYKEVSKTIVETYLDTVGF